MNYKHFVKQFFEEHRGEAPAKELMKMASAEWRESGHHSGVSTKKRTKSAKGAGIFGTVGDVLHGADKLADIFGLGLDEKMPKGGKMKKHRKLREYGGGATGGGATGGGIFSGLLGAVGLGLEHGGDIPNRASSYGQTIKKPIKRGQHLIPGSLNPVVPHKVPMSASRTTPHKRRQNPAIKGGEPISHLLEDNVYPGMIQGRVPKGGNIEPPQVSAEGGDFLSSILPLGALALL